MGKDVPIPHHFGQHPDSAGGEAQVEGDDSLTVRIVAHDTFPPAVPAGLQAVYSARAETFVDLIWAPVTDAISRDTTSIATSRRRPVKLNSDLVKSPSFRDNAVASGKTYFYSVSAVDVRANESARSEEAAKPCRRLFGGRYLATAPVSISSKAPRRSASGNIPNVLRPSRAAAIYESPARKCGKHAFKTESLRRDGTDTTTATLSFPSPPSAATETTVHLIARQSKRAAISQRRLRPLLQAPQQIPPRRRQ